MSAMTNRGCALGSISCGAEVARILAAFDLVRQEKKRQVTEKVARSRIATRREEYATGCNLM